MDKTELVKQVAELFVVSGHKVDTSVQLGNREIDIVATPLQGLVRAPVLVECAEYKKSVGVPKIQQDIDKLKAARKTVGEACVFMHVSLNGYSPNALGMARGESVTCYTLAELVTLPRMWMQ